MARKKDFFFNNKKKGVVKKKKKEREMEENKEKSFKKKKKGGGDRNVPAHNTHACTLTYTLYSCIPSALYTFTIFFSRFYITYLP